MRAARRWSADLPPALEIMPKVDALGNVTEVKAAKKALSKRDEKTALKAIKKKIQGGEELDEDEEELAMKNGLL